MVNNPNPKEDWKMTNKKDKSTKKIMSWYQKWNCPGCGNRNKYKIIIKDGIPTVSSSTKCICGIDRHTESYRKASEISKQVQEIENLQSVYGLCQVPVEVTNRAKKSVQDYLTKKEK